MIDLTEEGIDGLCTECGILTKDSMVRDGVRDNVCPRCRMALQVVPGEDGTAQRPS